MNAALASAIAAAAAMLPGLLFGLPPAAGTGRILVVEMSDKPPYVNPAVVQAGVGDTVVWHNNGPELVHTIVDEQLTLYSGDVKIQADWRYTFTKAGVYTYLCFRHNFMRGTVIVRNPDGSTDSAPDFAYQRAFKELVVPTMRSVPRMIVPSKVDDSIWFTEGGGDFYGFEDIPAQNKIAQVDEAGRFVEYATPTPGSDGSKVGVDSLVMDDGGNVWFTERLTNRVGKLEPGGRISETQLPNPKGYALGIDIDGAGKLWFAERYANRIGWLEPGGKLEEIELPEKDSEPRTIFVDSRQRAWYTARTANEIGYWDPRERRLTRLKLPTDNARPTGICETADGTIWFVEMVGNKVAKVVGDQIIEYPLPIPFSAPFKIAADQHGNVWFTQVFGNAVGRLEPATGRITELKIPTIDSRPGGIAVDRRGRVWFTEQMGNKIGMLDPVLADSLGARSAAAPPGPQPAPAAPAAPSPKVPAPTAAPSVPPRAGASHAALATVTGATIRDFPLPAEGAGPGNDLIEGEGGWLWFNEIYGNRIGAFHMRSHQFKEWQLPGEAAMPVGLARDRQGMLWATLFRGNALARLDPASGAVEQFTVPHDAALPAGITTDEHGEIWLTQLGANRIARFDRESRSFDEFELPRGDSNPLMIAADGHGGLWVSATEESGNYLARFDIAGRRFEIFDLPRPGASPVGLLIDEQGVWVAEGGAGRLARLDLATRKWQEFPLPAEKAEPVKLAKDADGRIWLTDGGGLGGPGGNRLAVFDPRSQRFELIPMRSGGAKPRGILAASDGNVWFTQQNANLLSRVLLREPDHGEP